MHAQHVKTSAARVRLVTLLLTPFAWYGNSQQFMRRWQVC